MSTTTQKEMEKEPAAVQDEQEVEVSELEIQYTPGEQVKVYTSLAELFGKNDPARKTWLRVASRVPVNVS
jgi:hypothetical protein